MELDKARLFATLQGDTPLTMELNEDGDKGNFAGLCIEDKGYFMGTARWVGEDGTFELNDYIADRPYVRPFLEHLDVFGQAARSVGRLKYPNQLLSGFIYGDPTKSSRYFVSSNHAFYSLPSYGIGIVSFQEYWTGASGPSRNPTRVFYVDFVANDTAAQITIWKFREPDLPHLPPPLALSSRGLQVNDAAVLMGYCSLVTLERVQELFAGLPDNLKRTTSVPLSQDLVQNILNPLHKLAAPGSVAQIIPSIYDNGDDGNSFGLSIRATAYHGMSGGPCFLIDPHSKTIGVAAIVVGALGSEHMNGNTVVSLHHPLVATLLLRRSCL